MAHYNLKVQLTELIESMFEEGLLNEQYHEIEALKSPDYPGFIAKVLTLFCENTEKILTELDKLINEDIVDYKETKQFAFWLKGSGLNIGAIKVIDASLQIHKSCIEKNKEGCMRALAEGKQEFIRLRSKLETVVQLENQIEMYEANEKK